MTWHSLAIPNTLCHAKKVEVEREREISRVRENGRANQQHSSSQSNIH